MLRSALIGGVVAACSCAALAEEWVLSDISVENGEMNIWQGHTPDVTAPMLERFSTVLSLDDAQREELRDLHAGYEDQHFKVWIEHAEKTADQQSQFSGMNADWEKIQREQAELFEKYKEESGRMTGLFFEDMRLLLTPEQEEAWPTIERDRLRQTTLTQYGCTPEERYDLVEFVNGLDLEGDDRVAANDVIERYAPEMDDALRARNRQLDVVSGLMEAYDEIQQQTYGFEWGTPEAEANYMRVQSEMEEKGKDAARSASAAISLCERVGEINMRYANELVSVLSPGIAGELEAAISTRDQEGFGWFGPLSYSRGRQMLQSVLNIDKTLDMLDKYEGSDETFPYMMTGSSRNARGTEPLTASQMTKIERMLEDLNAELEKHEENTPEVLKKMAEMQGNSMTIRTRAGSISLMKPQDPEDMVNWWDPSSMDEGDQNELNAWSTRRTEIEQKYIDQARKILTLRQRAMVLNY